MNRFAGWLLAVSALSLIVSVTSTLVSLFALRASREIAMHTATFQLHRFADEMSARNPQLLELHGITLEELAEAGVSSEELFYVYYSLESSEIYYRIQKPRKIELSDFRKNFLHSPRVRLIWKKFVRGRLFGATQFAQSIDEYVERIESLKT